MLFVDIIDSEKPLFFSSFFNSSKEVLNKAFCAFFLLKVLSVLQVRSIKLINSKIEEKGGLTNNAYKDSSLMMKVSMQMLSNQNIFVISYAWLRSSLLNIITPALLVDKRVRDLSHPSYAESGNIKNWLNKLFSNNNDNSYKYIIIFSNTNGNSGIETLKISPSSSFIV